MIVAIACLFGPAGYSIGESLQALFGFGDERTVSIVQGIRLPRASAAFAAGAALAAAGAALQGLLRNPLADPGVLGVSSAAALGAVLAIYFNLAAVATFATPLAAIVFALGATAVLSILGAGRVSTTRLILIGVGFSAFTSALITLAMNLSPNPFVLTDLVNWLFGSVANKSASDLVFVAPFMAAGLGLVVASGGGLSALTRGEEAAAAVGADVAKTRALAIAGTALLAGASVALAGAVGFVGIVAPHVVRPFVGHDPGRSILPSAVMGGAILAMADVFIRLLPFDQELRLGVAAALLGAPAFVWIAAKTQRLAQ
jgi:iron complex transport system permease protein